MRRQRKSDEKNTVNKLNKLIVEKYKTINKDLIKKALDFKVQLICKKHLYETKKSKRKYKISTNEGRLSDLEEKNKKMAECEIENKKLDEPVDMAEKMLDFNNQYQEGQRLKLKTLDQMLSRLPIFLAPLNPGIIQENLKMKEDNYCIVQKKLNKSTYKHLVSIISI